MSKKRDRRYLAHLTSPEVAALDKQNGVVILPIGAIEQHGPHLPLLTDTLLATHAVERTLAHLPAEVNAWALPPLNYGKSNEHLDFPGTVSLSSATLNAVLHDIAASVASAGFRRLAFVNGHGGNTPLLQATARDIRVTTGLMCFTLHSGAPAPFELSPEEQRYGLHAGETETSAVMAVAPELVHADRAVKHYPEFPSQESDLFFFGSSATAWTAADWSESGVFGDATLATAEKGERLIAAATKRLVKLITVVSTFEVANSPDDTR